MQNLIGPPLFLAGAVLMWRAISRRNRIIGQVEALQRAGLPDPRATLHPSLAIIGDVVPPLMIGGLVIIGLKLTLAYALLGAYDVVSPFDLAGLLFLIAGYGTWLVLKTRYRSMPAGLTVPVPAPLPATEPKPTGRRAAA